MRKQNRNKLGMRFGRLTVVGRVSDRPSHYHCLCDCGGTKVVRSGHLAPRKTASCGCLLKDGGRHLFKHGLSSSRTYRIWALMRERTKPENAHKFPNYAGRGISTCARWSAFTQFFADMGECPAGHSIERINNDGNYEPSNCKWLLLSRQWVNRRNTILARHNGELIALADLARASGIAPHTAYQRVRSYGWPPERAGTERVK